MRSDPRCGFASGEKVEAYLAGRLSEEEALRFEDHYILCGECIDLLESTDRFIRSVRAAGEILQASKACRLGPQRADVGRNRPGRGPLQTRSTR